MSNYYYRFQIGRDCESCRALRAYALTQYKVQNNACKNYVKINLLQ